MTADKSYRQSELMIVEAARQLRDRELVIIGTGFPMAATTLAKKTHAPNLIAVVESGAIDPIIERAPESVAGSTVMHKASRLGSLREVLGCVLQRGLIDVGMLGGAQVDQYGNVNSTVLGNYGSPKRRLPGSGGANDIASHSKRLLVIIPHERRRLPEKCDYITSPGNIDGPDGRKKARLRISRPPITLITNLAVMETEPDSGRFCITKMMPGIDLEMIYKNTGFQPKVASTVQEVEPPSAAYIKILREEVDPDGYYINRIKPAT